MKVRLILELSERVASKMTGESWEELRAEMRSGAMTVLCDVGGGDSGTIELILDGPA